MNITEPLSLLGGLSAQTFMQRHWHKKPLVIRQAIPEFVPPLDRGDLIAMAADPDVESRLVVQPSVDGKNAWKFRHGPFTRKSLPPLKQPGWTLLVQGVDLHDERVHALMNQFRFVPDARLDDVMISYATEGGGVGPHFDSYDVFLLQAHGQRRWRIGRQKDLSLVPNMPLKILDRFEPEEEFVLNPGDMLYLPPRYAHDGIAMGDCMTYSIGFRAPGRAELASELLQRLAEDAAEAVGEALYRDPKQSAVEHSARIPEALMEFARDALTDAVKDPQALQRALGEYLSEPKPQVQFDGDESDWQVGAIRLDRRTRLLYDDKHVFINGESYVASGQDARLIRALADERVLGAKDVQRLSSGAQGLLQDWKDAGWLYVDE